MSSKRFFVATTAIAMCQVSAFGQAAPVDMREAISVALASNPQIEQAQMNTEAIQAERRQGQGLYYPRVDIEGDIGARQLRNDTRRALGIANDWLYPKEARVSADWTVLDFGVRRNEVLRQAARVDGASLRVVERSEFVALQTARAYLDMLLQQRIAGATIDNTQFHRTLVSDLGRGVQDGTISVADQQQAQERLQAALVRQSEADQSLEDARIRLRTLTGLDINTGTMPKSYPAEMPVSESEAIGLARTDNPLVREAQADVDAANALASQASAERLPKIGVQVTGRVGDDIDGFRGRTRDLEGKAYLRWNVFDGGIAAAKVQEMVRRASEARFALQQRQREAEEDVRTAWSTLRTQRTVVEQVAQQSTVSDSLLESYRSQFNVGRRSLLDVLDAQNTRYNVQVRLETARFSELFAQYQTLAATHRFLTALDLEPGAGSNMNERERFKFGPPVPAELQRRTRP